MTNNSPFDDHIKKQLGNYKPEVPPHIWENILAQKGKKKPAGFLFSLRGNRTGFILLLFIATAAGALLVRNIYKTDSNKISGTNEQAASSNTGMKDQNNSLKNTTTGNKDVTNDNTPENKLSNNAVSVPAQKINSTNTNAVIEEAADIRPTQSIIENKKTRALPTASHLNNSIKENSNDTKRADNLLAKKTVHEHAKKKDDAFQSVNDHNDVVATRPVTTKQKIKGTAVGRSAMSIEKPGTETTTTTSEIATDAATSSNGSDVLLEKKYLNLNTKSTEKIFSFSVKNINISSLNIPCPGSGKNGAANKRYFEIYGGPDYAFRTFNDTANSTYLQKRKESTHVSSAFSFGIRYTKVFNNAISFRTGINYSQVNETFKFEQGHMVQLVYIIAPNGDTTGSYATTGTRYKTTHNRYRTIDIPIMVGYEMGNGRLRTNISAGLVVNAYSWQKGDILDSAYQPVNITTGKSNSPYQFKTNVGLGFMGGVSFYYRLTGNLHILAEPYFRYNFSAANKADITLKQKYTTAGLRLGLRIDF